MLAGLSLRRTVLLVATANLSYFKAGLRSNGVAWHPDRKRLYVSNGGKCDRVGDRFSATT